MSLDKRFLKDPAGFAKQHALNPQGNRTSQAAGSGSGFRAADLKDKQVAPGFNFFQVQGANRILYCTISQGGASSDDAALLLDTRQDGNICRMEFSPTPQNGSAFPVFWLPWQADKAVRIMLKTSKHETRTTGRRNDPVEPTIFVTAALSGCSVFVEGDRQQPVVYHQNANAISPGAVDIADPTLHTRIDSKMSTMENRYRQISTSNQHGKVPLGKQGTSVADMTMYMGSELSHTGSQGRQAAALAQLPIDPALASLTNARGNTKSVGEVQTMMTFGTVFGVKDTAGMWTFYHQSRTRADFWAKRDPRAPDSDYSNWERKTRWVALSCREFWPNGARQIQR